MVNLEGMLCISGIITVSTALKIHLKYKNKIIKPRPQQKTRNLSMPTLCARLNLPQIHYFGSSQVSANE